MVRTRTLSFLLTVGVLLVVGCGGNNGGDSNAEAGLAPLSVSNGGAVVVVDDSWKACDVDEDCVRIYTACNGCCNQDAVSASVADVFAERARPLCKDYQGSVCDCVPAETQVRCQDRRCRLIPQP